MLVYVVRRLVAAVFLLLIVTAATFVIFFVVPRLGGATVDDLASRYVGKAGNAQDIHAIAVKLGFTDPIWVQYGRFLAALFVGTDYSTQIGSVKPSFTAIAWMSWALPALPT